MYSDPGAHTKSVTDSKWPERKGFGYQVSRSPSGTSVRVRVGVRVRDRISIR
jgi:hypothetical protein